VGSARRGPECAGHHRAGVRQGGCGHRRIFLLRGRPSAQQGAPGGISDASDAVPANDPHARGTVHRHLPESRGIEVESGDSEKAEKVIMNMINYAHVKVRFHI